MKAVSYTHLDVYKRQVNSISMSVSARTNQYGAMRAVGMDSLQIKKMILMETATYTCLLYTSWQRSVCLTIWKRSVDWGIAYEIIRVSFRSNFFIDMYAGVGTPTVWPALAN